jgi:hypothetical protein
MALYQLLGELAKEAPGMLRGRRPRLVIISVGYRVKSHRGTPFRFWATGTLREYLVQGFVINDEGLEGSETNYFEEVIERVPWIENAAALEAGDE